MSSSSKAHPAGQHRSESGTKRPMTFELMDRFLNTNISPVLTSETWSLQYFNHRIEVRTPAESDRTLRDGRLGVARSQALRARLRSHCPSGTETIRPPEVSH